MAKQFVTDIGPLVYNDNYYYKSQKLKSIDKNVILKICKLWTKLENMKYTWRYIKYLFILIIYVKDGILKACQPIIYNECW